MFFQVLFYFLRFFKSTVIPFPYRNHEFDPASHSFSDFFEHEVVEEPIISDDESGNFSISTLISKTNSLLVLNFFFPISTQQRQAVIQDLYVSGGKMSTTQCVLRFTDNGQKVNVGGGFNKEDYHVGDTVTVTYQHGCLGMDVVRYVK